MNFIGNTALMTIGLAFGIQCTNEPAAPNLSTTDLQSDKGWRVTWFWDKDKDETLDFGAYTFYFRTDGTFEATQSNLSVSGTWRTNSDDGSQRLVLAISTLKPLSELNDDWIIVEMNEKVIRLKDDNDEHLEELHFEAN